jgi:hypothetical protein
MLSLPLQFTKHFAVAVIRPFPVHPRNPRSMLLTLGFCGLLRPSAVPRSIALNGDSSPPSLNPLAGQVNEHRNSEEAHGTAQA